MKITKISVQKKRPDRYNIFVDDAYTCSLSGGALLSSGVKAGDELDADQLQHLVSHSKTDLAYSQLLQLIARRPRSIWEAEQYLKKKDYDDKSIQEVIARLKDKSYLDDYAFAESWVRSRRLTRSTSQKKLGFELRQKHIADHIVADCLANDEKDDVGALRELINKKRRQSRYQDNEKLMRYLAGQGFYYGDIKSALELVEEESSQQ